MSDFNELSEDCGEAVRQTRTSAALTKCGISKAECMSLLRDPFSSVKCTGLWAVVFRSISPVSLPTPTQLASSAKLVSSKS